MVAIEKGLELPNIFRDHSYVYASRYKLSTSQVNEIHISELLRSKENIALLSAHRSTARILFWKICRDEYRRKFGVIFFGSQ